MNHLAARFFSSATPLLSSGYRVTSRPHFLFKAPSVARPISFPPSRIATTPRTMSTSTSGSDPRPIFFFDIDNCLYSRECNIHDEMQKLINQFFRKHLSLSAEDAHMLHMKYYKEYGLAIEGLTRHHKIDPLEFNREVDDALPLDTILKPNPGLRKLLKDIDRSKVRLWLLTNAYVNHAKRVVKLLQVEDLFDGVTYCDYAQLPLICKPNQAMYERAEKEAGAPPGQKSYFVDDSHLNCVHATKRGWVTAHLVEPSLDLPPTPASQYVIRDLEELRTCFPDLFKS